MENNFPIQVTKFYKEVWHLYGWKKFLEGRGYETIVVVQEKLGHAVNALFRNLSAKEEKEMEGGKLVIRDCFLMKAKNFVALKEVDQWK